MGDRASAEGGCGEPARGAKHEQGLGAAPVLSDLLGPQPCAQRWALPSGLRPAPKGGLATGQPECNGRATRRETPLLERPAHAVCAQRCWMFAMQRLRSVVAEVGTHSPNHFAVIRRGDRTSASVAGVGGAADVDLVEAVVCVRTTAGQLRGLVFPLHCRRSLSDATDRATWTPCRPGSAVAREFHHQSW